MAIARTSESWGRRRWSQSGAEHVAGTAHRPGPTHPAVRLLAPIYYPIHVTGKARRFLSCSLYIVIYSVSSVLLHLPLIPRRQAPRSAGTGPR